MEKLFQPEPTAGRRDSASGPSSRERLSSPAGASARPRFAAPPAAVAGAISKSFQEVSGPPQPASCLGAVLPPPLLLRLSASPAAALPGRPQRLFSRGGGGGGGGWRCSGRPDWRLLLRDRSHDTGKLRQDGSRYPARLRCSGAHPPPASSPALPPPPPSPRRPPCAPPTSSAAGRRCLRGKRFPEDPEARGEADGGAGEGPRARGGRRGAPAGSAGRAAPRPLPSPPPGRPGTAARLPWELCSFPSNYLSEQRVGGGPKKGPSLLEGLPISIRGALWVRERGQCPRLQPARPPSFPPSPLSSFVASTLGHDTALAVSPPPAWEFAVWTHSEHRSTWDRICT
ncbi:uncharacterized protein LOC144613820 [Panthera onca]